MKGYWKSIVLSICCFSLLGIVLMGIKKKVDPPFGGTIFIDPDIITPEDSSTFEGIAYAGKGMRTMYDRRVNNWINVEAFLFDATFNDGLTAEIQVNPEFDHADSAAVQAKKYGWAIGQLPTSLRSDMETVWIHKGVQPFGGGNNNILIHIGQADLYIADGILEETLIHEASHTSLDGDHANSEGWQAAQASDPTFISTYARDNPSREDVAESFLPYLAIRYREDRISAQLAQTIRETIPNRIAYFDAQELGMFPISGTTTDLSNQRNAFSVNLYPNPSFSQIVLTYQLPEKAFVEATFLNELGQELATMIQQNQSADQHEIFFDVSPFPKGIYFVRLKLNGTIVTTKKVLNR